MKDLSNTQTYQVNGYGGMGGHSVFRRNESARHSLAISDETSDAFSSVEILELVAFISARRSSWKRKKGALVSLILSLFCVDISSQKCWCCWKSWCLATSCCLCTDPKWRSFKASARWGFDSSKYISASFKASWNDRVLRLPSRFQNFSVKFVWSFELALNGCSISVCFLLIHNVSPWSESQMRTLDLPFSPEINSVILRQMHSVYFEPWFFDNKMQMCAKSWLEPGGVIQHSSCSLMSMLSESIAAIVDSIYPWIALASVTSHGQLASPVGFEQFLRALNLLLHDSAFRPEVWQHCIAPPPSS